MSTTNMATWVAHMEHQEKLREFARQQQLLDDILPDDYEVRAAFEASSEGSSQVRIIPLTLRNWLTALTRRMAPDTALDIDTSLTEECLGC